MKNHNLFSFYYLILFGILLSLGSCKKKKAFEDESGQSAVDNQLVQRETNAAISEINDAIGQQAALHGRVASADTINGVTGNLCGITLDTLGLSTGTVTLNYAGAACQGRVRSGSIRLSIPGYTTGLRWMDSTCVINLEYLHYTVAQPDGKSIELNGLQTLTNESGGTWWELLNLKSRSYIAYSIRGKGLSVRFEDGSSASYNINLRYRCGLVNSVLTCTVDGIGTLSTATRLENYGLTRAGNAFRSQVTDASVWNLHCGPRAALQGSSTIVEDRKDFDLKTQLGVDASGTAEDTSSLSCAYGWKVEWNYKKKTKTKVAGY